MSDFDDYLKEEYRIAHKIIDPLASEFEIKQGYQYYLAKLSGDYASAQKAYIQATYNIQYFREGSFN